MFKILPLRKQICSTIKLQQKYFPARFTDKVLSIVVHKLFDDNVEEFMAKNLDVPTGDFDDMLIDLYMNLDAHIQMCIPEMHEIIKEKVKKRGHRAPELVVGEPRGSIGLVL